MDHFKINSTNISTVESVKITMCIKKIPENIFMETIS